MRLPRDLGAPNSLPSCVATATRSPVKQEAIRLTSRLKSTEHHVTIPRHEPLRVGTLSAILADVASYLETSRSELVADLFGR